MRSPRIVVGRLNWVATLVVGAIAYLLIRVGAVRAARGYLRTLAGLAAFGLFMALVTGTLRIDPTDTFEAIKAVGLRQQVVATAPQVPAPAPVPGTATRKLSISVRIGSEADRSEFDRLKAALLPDRYVVGDAELAGTPVDHSEIRYCDPESGPDADALAALLTAKLEIPFAVRRTETCEPPKGRDTLDVWIHSAP